VLGLAIENGKIHALDKKEKTRTLVKEYGWDKNVA